MSPSEIRQAVEWACILEATAQKPGNVHPRASFADLDYLDFVRAALASSEPLSIAYLIGVGEAVLDVVKATQSASRSNVNLGIALLLAPLCAAAGSHDQTPISVPTLEQELQWELEALSIVDAKQAFEAIRRAVPGGLGTAPAQDVHNYPTISLLDAMKLAADRDSIARQYANGFQDVFDVGLAAISDAVQMDLSWERVVIRCHLAFMAAIPDTLIGRKLGAETALESQRRAQVVLDRNCGAEAVEELDAWLRADGNKRNPGASADLTAASLFVAAVTGVFPPQKHSASRRG